MSSIESKVRDFSVLSSCRYLRTTSWACCIGTFVDNDTRSWELKTFSSIIISDISAAKSLEFSTWCSLFPTRGDKMWANDGYKGTLSLCIFGVALCYARYIFCFCCKKQIIILRLVDLFSFF